MRPECHDLEHESQSFCAVVSDYRTSCNDRLTVGKDSEVDDLWGHNRFV
jgi:hypothetical protein